MKRENKVANEVIKVFWIFMIGSVIGYVVEMIVAFVQKGHLESRQGLVYGPFTPIYGIGMVLYFFVIPKIKGSTTKIFLFSMIVGGTIEYLCSFFQEKFFGTVSWDYSQLWFNINGRTSLLHCIYWGTAGVLFMKLIYPLITGMDSYLLKRSFQYVTIVLFTFMIFNVGISWMAGNRQKERALNIPAENQMEAWLDVHYPDSRMNKIYANKIEKVAVNK